MLSLIDVNPSDVSLEWTAPTDDGPHLSYQVYVDGNPNVDVGTSRSAVVQGPAPENSYVITVKARDFYGQNVSPPSNAITVTTGAISGEDTQPPSPPGDLTGGDMGSGEVWLFWTDGEESSFPRPGGGILRLMEVP